jgi:hypothetical protein
MFSVFDSNHIQNDFIYRTGGSTPQYPVIIVFIFKCFENSQNNMYVSNIIFLNEYHLVNKDNKRR